MFELEERGRSDLSETAEECGTLEASNFLIRNQKLSSQLNSLLSVIRPL